MFRILRALFRQVPREVANAANRTGLRWEYKTNTPHTYNSRTKDGWEPFVQYHCDVCDSELQPGPSGAGTNQVCNKCRVNFGCLPNAIER